MPLIGRKAFVQPIQMHVLLHERRFRRKLQPQVKVVVDNLAQTEPSVHGWLH